MCSCNETDQVSSNVEESTPEDSASEQTLTESQSNTSVSPSNEKSLMSRKFIAFLVTLVTALGVFLLVYFNSREIESYKEFLHNIFLVFAVYTGGNSLEKITRLRK